KSVMVVPDSVSPAATHIVIERPRARPSGTIVLRGARLLTIKGNEIIERGDIVVRGDRIAAIGASGTVAVPAGTRVIDVNGNTIAPGFIDRHAHWRGTSPGDRRSWSLESSLAHGVTTGREPQANTDIFTLADLADAGQLLAPRIFAVGPSINSDEDVESQP